MCYRPLLRYIGMATVALGVLLFGVDRAEGLPLFWRAGEGPLDIELGLAILWLSRGRQGVSDAAAGRGEEARK